jgi:hypothetical protein
MSDKVCKGLLKELGYNPEEKGVDVGSRVSGASALTGDAETVGASTVNSEATTNRVLKTKEYMKQLADSRVRNAEQAAELNELKAQMQNLTQMLAGINQPGSPHLSGSGAARPQDEGSGAAPQGTSHKRTLSHLGMMSRGLRCSVQTPFVSFAQVGPNGEQNNLATDPGAVNVSVGVDRTTATFGNGAQRVVRGNHPTQKISNTMTVNQRAKSRRRRDAWLNNRASIEQKRKYRALLKGYKTFKTKCMVKDVDVEKAISHHRTSDCSPNDLMHPSEFNEIAMDRAIDIERREMNQLIELLQEGGVGYVPKRKPNGWVRLMFENWNSLGMFTHSWKVERLNHLVSDLQVDLVAGCETNATGNSYHPTGNSYKSSVQGPQLLVLTLIMSMSPSIMNKWEAQL